MQNPPKFTQVFKKLTHNLFVSYVEQKIPYHVFQVSFEINKTTNLGDLTKISLHALKNP